MAEGVTVAIKQVSFVTEAEQAEAEAEVELLLRLRHPHVVTFYGQSRRPAVPGLPSQLCIVRQNGQSSAACVPHN